MFLNKFLPDIPSIHTLAYIILLRGVESGFFGVVMRAICDHSNLKHAFVLGMSSKLEDGKILAILAKAAKAEEIRRIVPERIPASKSTASPGAWL